MLHDRWYMMSNIMYVRCNVCMCICIRIRVRTRVPRLHVYMSDGIILYDVYTYYSVLHMICII